MRNSLNSRSFQLRIQEHSFNDDWNAPSPTRRIRRDDWNGIVTFPLPFLREEKDGVGLSSSDVLVSEASIAVLFRFLVDPCWRLGA